MIGDIIIGVLGNTAYDILKGIYKKHFGAEEDPVYKLFIESIKSATEIFFDTYGDVYGTIHSSFLSKEQNWEVILNSIFYGAEEIDENSFILSGFGLSKRDALVGAKHFLKILNNELRKIRALEKILAEKKHIIESARDMKETKETVSLIWNTLQSNAISNPYYPTTLVDQKIKDELNSLCKSRFFPEYETVRSSLALARKLVNGELSGGTDTQRCRALAWCARFLSAKGDLPTASEYLNLAKTLGACHEVDIANAIISSSMGDKNTALRILAGIDSALSRSASLFVVIHHEGAKHAIEWLDTVRIDVTELDSYGRYLLLTQYLSLSYWEDATQTINMLTEQDLHECPILYRMIGITHLLSTVPSELKATVFNQLPFDAANFPLASDSTSIHARRTAQQYFTEAAAFARQHNCPRAATEDENYALWLELRDPENSAIGRQRLEAKLREPNSALRFVPLALQFNIKLDLIAAEQEIERQIALHGEITKEAAIARFALVFTKKTPDEAASYITRHYVELSNYLDKRSLKILQIELVLQAGLREKANEYLKDLIEEGISDEEQSRIIGLFSDVDGIDSVESRKMQFEQTGALGDLVRLIDELESRESWGALSYYGEILFEKTRTVNDAERLAKALTNTHKTERLIELINANYDYLNQSSYLRFMYSWALYNEGNILESRTELLKLNDNEQRDRNYRVLQVNLGITLGDWHSLTVFIKKEILEKDMRSPQELISAAYLALRLNLQHYAKELIVAAVAVAKSDAGVYASAYFLATNAGWEENEEISHWLQEAIELSGDDGPLKKMTLKDILDHKPDWDRRESDTWQSLSRGDIPQFLAAHSLNKSLVGLMLYPARVNLIENEPRRKGLISAYSGNRLPRRIDDVKVIGIDATALLTLGFLNLLDKTFNAFVEVHIPHSTLNWLFEEKQKITFHQPTRIIKAKQLRHMLATDSLGKFESNIAPNSDLSVEVGDELAMLITEAERVRRDNNTQSFVVRPYPVHRLSSLMEEEVDLSKHANIMSSCLSIVNMLRKKGQITAEEERKARVYLELQEKPWPDQPEITDGAILYLDDLTVNYFQHLGLLEKLKSAGFRPIVSPRAISESNELISYETISENIEEIIERIRVAVSTRIESGEIKVGRRQKNNEFDDSSITEHPTVGVIALASRCEVIISDDRFLNQHQHFEINGVQTQISTTLDVIDALTMKSVITSNDRLEYKTQLRRAGYLFIPIEENELTTHLEDSLVVNGNVVETAELKAIRENVLSIRMVNWLQLPKEALWLNSFYEVYHRVLKNLWSVKADLSNVIAYSNWLLEQLDIRGWAHRFEDGDYFASAGRGIFILALLSPPADVQQDVKDEYWNWITEKILLPIKEHYQDLFDWLVEWYKGQIIEIADKSLLRKYGLDNFPFGRSVIVQAALKLFPPLIGESLFEDKELRETYGLSVDAILSLNGLDISFQRSELYDAIRKIKPDIPEIEVIDTKGRVWNLTSQNIEPDKPALVISLDKQNFILPDFLPFLTDSVTRLRSLDNIYSDTSLPVSSKNRWFNTLSKRALEDEEIDEFNHDVSETPVYKARLIRRELENGKSSISSLVPSSKMYFERLVGCYDGSMSIKDYAAGQGRRHFETLLSINPYDGMLISLYMSLHSDLTAEIKMEYLATEELVRVYEFLEVNGDRVSQLGAIEIGLRILPVRPEIGPFIMRLVKQIRDDDVVGSTSGIQLFSALFVLVDGELSRIRLFSSAPPFYRRLASLSHAALIHRQLINSDINIDLFCDWALYTSGEQFYFQSLIDMRQETRWSPDFALASQLKAEFIGRIMIAANKYAKNITHQDLHDLVLGTKPESLSSFVEIHHMYFPGPLEGMEDSPHFLPHSLSDAIQIQLDSEEISPMSFTALMNSAIIYRVESNHAELAASVLKLGRHRLTQVRDKPQFVATLNGLASVAAVCRNSSLADELRILLRVYRHDSQYSLTIDEVLRICLVAAACYENLNQWREFVGDWLTELAFSKLNGDEGMVFLSRLKCLCHVIPELWVTSGKAEAALRAFTACPQQ